MHALIVSLVLFGQTDVPLPPAPAVRTPAVTETAAEMKAWLQARLIIDLSFDPQNSAEVERMLDRMNEGQLRALVAAYQERTPRPKIASPRPMETGNQTALEQAKLEKQQAEAYRDHLKREYDRRLLQGYMNQNLVHQNLVNNQRLMYQSSFGYSPLGFGGLGYGVMNYGGFGFGAPGFGVPLYGGGLSVW